MLSLIATVIAFIYQLFGFIGIVPALSENEVIEICGLIVNVLVAIGVVTDPTTAGLNDSERAMNYVIPNPDNDPDEDEELPQ